MTEVPVLGDTAEARLQRHRGRWEVRGQRGRRCGGGAVNVKTHGMGHATVGRGPSTGSGTASGGALRLTLGG